MRLQLCFCVLGLFLAACAASARNSSVQTRGISGNIRAPDGEPLESVSIIVEGLGAQPLRELSNASGYFAISSRDLKEAVGLRLRLRFSRQNLRDRKAIEIGYTGEPVDLGRIEMSYIDGPDPGEIRPAIVPNATGLATEIPWEAE